MSNRKPRAANRRIAEISSGTRATEGEAPSHPTSGTYDIVAARQSMFNESPEDLAALGAEYHEQYSPANDTERLLVETLVHTAWHLRRMRRLEAEIWNGAANTFLANNVEARKCTAADAFVTSSSAIERLQRVIDGLERTYHRALKDLRVARAHGRRSLQPEQSTATSAFSASVRTNPAKPQNPGVAAGNLIAFPTRAAAPKKLAPKVPKP